MNSLVAVVLSSLFAAGFVGSIYFAPSHLEPLSRNHPQKAFWRMKAIGLVSLVTTVVICALLCFEWHACIRFLGFGPESLSSVSLFPLLHAMMLFAGPLVEFFLEGASESFRKYTPLPVWLRDLVIAPLAEELVYRVCCAIPLLLAGFSDSTSALLTALIFGCSHLHHFFELKRTLSIKEAALNVVVQFAYTSLFGFYVGIAFLRTGSFLSIALVHGFCNMMGLPSATFLSDFYNTRLRVTIGVAYLVGILLFAVLWPTMLAAQEGALVHVVERFHNSTCLL